MLKRLRYLPFLKPDGDIIINSDKALELSSIPEKMLVVGAGAIGVEMAVIYSYLGSTVTIVGVGTTTITASQDGNATYNPAIDVPQNLTVNKAELTDKNLVFAGSVV